ncbi:MAG: glucose-1-phosphate thymidylyltransferase [Flavobacteriales bacterium]|nr:MAG: glucose-1-phosphate thymidylyltransferase [Flavobacteriales bacterium]
MNIILFDGAEHQSLLPFTYTRPIADIRIGILTIREKWEKLLQTKTSTLTKSYLAEKYPLIKKEIQIYINGSFLPTHELVNQVKTLSEKEVILYNDSIVAYKSKTALQKDALTGFKTIHHKESELLQIRYPWDIFALNDKSIRFDYELITKGRKSAPIPKTVNCLNPENVFLEEGVDISFAILNAKEGPIYIGKNAVIMEGSMLRGPLAICNSVLVKMGAKIYEATTAGPFSKICGEVNNTVIFGYSGKVHEGYLGNAVLGEWCNIGADTNNSNLKNNYAEVKVWDYSTDRFVKTGHQFCGMFMGDHSKCGINTMFNTGTTIGVCANIYGSNFPRNFIPSFSWGGAAGFTTYQLNKVDETIKLVMQRKHKEYNAIEQRIIHHVFKISKKYRNFK